MQAWYISSAETTLVVFMLCSISISEGPNTKCTCAPLLKSSSAMATPILPLEWFPMNLTGSIASWVGPAVTNALIPVSSDFFEKNSFKKSMISSGSAILPFPVSPLANSPLFTGRNLFPCCFKIFIFSFVAGWSHISSSIAGAITTGHLEER